MLILLVEDDRFFQSFYSTKLTENGYTVQIASDGIEAMTKLAAVRPDMILLDLIMPRKDGFEVLTELQANPNLRTIPVLVFSTLGQENDIARARQLGARDYVNKTFFDFDNLLGKISTLVQKPAAG